RPDPKRPPLLDRAGRLARVVLLGVLLVPAARTCRRGQRQRERAGHQDSTPHLTAPPLRRPIPVGILARFRRLRAASRSVARSARPKRVGPRLTTAALPARGAREEASTGPPGRTPHTRPQRPRAERRPFRPSP